ncbi:MAG TPA: hypothetical protein VHU86_00675 [Solirubrobacterales bacterium]|nr:hypothetical protein [Solirubrobacterales bacterium]
MRALTPLLFAALLTLAIALGTSAPSDSDAHLSVPPSGANLVPAPPPRIECERPRTLRLRRFEDRSARLECAGHILVRVSVPG